MVNASAAQREGEGLTLCTMPAEWMYCGKRENKPNYHMHARMHAHTHAHTHTMLSPNLQSPEDLVNN